MGAATEFPVPVIHVSCQRCGAQTTRPYCIRTITTDKTYGVEVSTPERLCAACAGEIADA